MKNSLAEKALTDCPHTHIYRPIQYLGSKVRSISHIIEVIEAFYGSKGQCVDLFSGSSVVSQAMAQNGLQTIAVDTQKACSTIAKASLGVQRQNSDFLSEADIKKILSCQGEELFDPKWEKFLKIEDKAIRESDAQALIQLAEQTPLFWRTDKKSSDPNPLGRSIEEVAFSAGPLITSIQAGYYFGVKQSIDIDIIRLNIEKLFSQGEISYWKYNAALTALLSAMSKAVNSAGKHFAQPLIAGTAKNKNFIHKRLLFDRNISIENSFQESISELNKIALFGCDNNSAECCDANDFLETSNLDQPFIYADPPYTAQQYSRFYHLLETVVTYKIPDMLHNGKITTGLYPKDRYLSKYCSKRQAPSAFHSLVSQAHRMRAFLVLSYSTSASESNGNARMISLQDLTDICTDIYGNNNVEISFLDHQYRQFNSSGNSQKTRDNPEVMLICKP